ncbi:MAG: hypothetical protein MPL62_18280, partial [Alphaproteobacteria bacterium]|nr:hypothetical protein [Alphaproteobacteria bacterium]
MAGIARTYEYWDSYGRGQTLPLLRDYIRNPGRYPPIKCAPGEDPRLGFGTVFTSRLLVQILVSISIITLNKLIDKLFQLFLAPLAHDVSGSPKRLPEPLR